MATLRILWPLSLAMAAALPSCAPSSNDDGTPSSASQSSAASTGAGGGGGQLACEEDCSLLPVPQCQVPDCDETTGQCRTVAGPDDYPCDDGKFCTTGDTCHGGVCQGGPPNECGMPSDDCTVSVCHENTRTCSLAAANNGIGCQGANKCIINGHCNNGVCVGPSNDCMFAPGGECNTLTCNPATGDCDPTPDPDKNGAACSSTGDLCMLGKTCSEGACVGGTPKDCSALTQGCNDGKCDLATGQCVATPVAEGEPCLAATDACNIGICTAAACVPTPVNEGNACEDGDACTVGETCLLGACQGGTPGSYVQYFTEDFADNGAGWTLGPEWQIGPAQASSCSSTTHDDPAQDHSLTADNGVGGVVIGGCAATVLHGYQYLESPVFDASGPGPVWLEFWRFLNSDYSPFMTNSIEVFDGSQWVVVWQSVTETPEDASWQHTSYELTPYKNGAMRIRFGFTVGVTGVSAESSWNVDDVVVANQVCN